MRILFLYFTVFVVFCAVNQYSWLQPLTGFRYLVPVVPALGLLALQTAQILPPVLRWVIAAASFLQALAMTASYQNDVRVAVAALIRRHGELVWLIRLRDVGAPVAVWWQAVWAVLLAGALVIVWRNKASPQG
jgi:hypothetical protein